MKGEKESENKKDGRRGEGAGSEKGWETGRGRSEVKKGETGRKRQGKGKRKV